MLSSLLRVGDLNVVQTFDIWLTFFRVWVWFCAHFGSLRFDTRLRFSVIALPLLAALAFLLL